MENTDAEFRHFVEGNKDFAVFLINPAGYITSWSAGAEHVLGYTLEEARGEHLSLIFTPEASMAGQPAKELGIAVAEGRFHEEGWHLRKNGSRFWASGVLTAFKNETGHLCGFCKIVRDRTEHRQAEEERQAAHQRDRRIAEVLQGAMLVPVKEDQFPYLSVATLHEAAWTEAEVGGDFYDGFLVSDTLVALAVGDASGKGLLAAVRTTQIKDVLRALLRSSQDADAPGVMARLNDYLCHSSRLDANDEPGFVCLSLVLLDTQTGEATFVVAGAEPPLVLRTGDGVVSTESIETPGLPLGVFPDEKYPVTVRHLEPGDAVLLITDGLTEARRGNEFLTFEGLTELAQHALHRASVPEAAQEILDGAKAFAKGKLHDDACLLLARRIS